MNILKEITKKEIEYKSSYLSYTKSMLHLPIFTVSKNVNKDRDYEIIIDKFEGFRNIKLKFPGLSIKNDFMVFSFILRKFYKNCDNSIENPFQINFDFNEFFDFFEVKRQNRSAYTDTIIEVLGRLSRINLSFVRGDNQYISNFLTEAVIEKRRNYKVSISKSFLNLFKHDENLLFNIDLDKYKSLDKEFSKILYIYYITNTHKANINCVARFDISSIKIRLQSSSSSHKFFEHLRAAHKELIDNKMIKEINLIKNGNRIEYAEVEFLPKKVSELKAEFKDNLESNDKLNDVSGFDEDNFVDPDYSHDKNVGDFEKDYYGVNNKEEAFDFSDVDDCAVDDEYPF
ncbi:TPA: hypothetical protein ACIDXN_003662 [Pseudomonas aeruginosa]